MRMATNKAKKVIITEEEPQVRKVIKRVNIIDAPTMAELEEKVNQFLETVAYNDLGMAETVRLYWFNGVFYAKMEYDVRIRK
jgi:hypothetical protein